MKKALFVLAIMLCLSIPAQADIFENSKTKALKASNTTATAISPDDLNTILDVVKTVGDRLGVRDGYFYDIETNSHYNYAAVTVYTEPNTNIAADIGILNLNGIAASADYNLGSLIPAGDPVGNLLQYAYVGFGVGYTHTDEFGDKIAYGPTAQFKFTV